MIVLIFRCIAAIHVGMRVTMQMLAYTYTPVHKHISIPTVAFVLVRICVLTFVQLHVCMPLSFSLSLSLHVKIHVPLYIYIHMFFYTLTSTPPQLLIDFQRFQRRSQDEFEICGANSSVISRGSRAPVRPQLGLQGSWIWTYTYMNMDSDIYIYIIM